MTTKRQPVDYAAQVAARRAAALAAADNERPTAEDAPTSPPSGGQDTARTNGAASIGTAGTQAPEQSTGGSDAETKTETQQPAIGDGAAQEQTQSIAVHSQPERPIGVSAYTPIVKKKVDRQGIDLRPVDRERWERFEMFCLRHRMRLGKKKGLSLYARAGLQLLDELIARDEAAAEALLRSIGEAERRETA